MTEFRAETFHNQYLAAGATTVDAIVSITASGAPAAGTVTTAAEVIILDVSGSMAEERKLAAAKKAAAAAIDCLRDGTLFGVVAGNQFAFDVYPTGRCPVPANEHTRAEAKQAVGKLRPGGGTAIGQWLVAAERLFPDDPGAIRHAILLTDGQNAHESPEELAAKLAGCAGRFQCDCRGVGTDWDVNELRGIATALLGTVDIIREPAGMEADFRSMMRQSMGKMTSEATLRVWAPAGATVELVAQVQPAFVDLTGRRADVAALVGDYPTGAWANESRDYHVRLTFPARDVAEEMLAGRVSLVVADDVVSQALITVTWTDDLNLSTKVVQELAHYVVHEEAVAAIRDGLAALDAGDTDTATRKLARARDIAVEAGNADRVAEIEKILDPRTRRLRANIDEADVMELDTRSVRTARIGR